ncbi:MAG TPA: class IV adenylate cyclase [Gemmatales bacterium]|nr:class IV adenylate cyclase [Gemmatales bacterium]
MLEVEMKFKVTMPERIQEQLNIMGFLPGEKHFESDRYYNAPDRDFAQSDEALRIRQVGDESQLTYKGPKQGAKGKVRTEHEVQLNEGSARMMHQILVDLRYKPSIEVNKERTFYRHLAQKDIEIAWDEVQGLGTYIELELKVPEGDQAEALFCLQSLAESMGLRQEERRSYLELLLHQKA